MTSPAILEVPGGAVWKVDLLELDGEVWLDKGWQEFAEYYLLEYGHFLVFKHTEISHFRLLIFDKSGSEIEYPKPNHEGELQNAEVVENDNDSLIEVLDDLLSHKKLEHRSQCLGYRRTTRIASNISEKLSSLSLQACHAPFNSFCRRSSCRKLEKSECSLQKFGETCTQSKCKGRPRGRPRKTLNTRASRTVEAANNFVSNFPFFFVVVRQYHIRHSNVVMPYCFFRKHIEDKSGTVMLQVADRMWPVKLRKHPKCQTIKISSGWSAFSKANSLKDGDVCVFELIKRNVLQVMNLRGGN